MTSSPSLFFRPLASRIQGDLCCGAMDRYMLATDGSIFKKEPLAVVYPKSCHDVVATVNFARRHHLSLHPRGSGSGLCGSALGDGLVIDFSRYMNRLLALDLDASQFECEPGYRLGELNQVLEGSGLFFPPDPSSGEYASFGGMAATNASGAHSVKYGNVADYIVDAQIVLSSGETIQLSRIRRRPLDDLSGSLKDLKDLYQQNEALIEQAYPDLSHNVSGYNLRSLIVDGHLHLERLFAGAEGTLGVVTRLTFRLIPKPAHDSLVVAYFDRIDLAARAVNLCLPMAPAGIEVMDKSLLELARAGDSLLREKIPAGIDNVLLLEFDGTDFDKTKALGEAVRDLLKRKELSKNVHLALSFEEKQKFWALRTAAVPILYRLKGRKKILALIEDAVVPPAKLGDYFKGLYEILMGQGVEFVLYGHIAKGLIHTRPLLNLKEPEDIALLRTIADEVYLLVRNLGGVVSGEHGDGRLRSAYIARQYPQIYPLFLAVKHALDPDNLFNPEIKTSTIADQMQQDLRYGTSYHAHDSGFPHLYFPDGFTTETEKCHGCSKCTTVTTATRMCPIYKFTRRESASPKAKANILRGLISGAFEADFLYHREFQRVMEECVNCGSCKVECPSHVDIPRLVLEARSRFIARHRAPLSHHLLTRVEEMGRMMTAMGKGQRLVEKLLARPLTGRFNERFLGLARQRPAVTFTRHTLPRQRIASTHCSGKRVLYFAGCYATYMRPEIKASLDNVLRLLGIKVLYPPQHCCGLPLLSKGMVTAAQRKVHANLSKWYHLIDEIDHIVVTCSSCGLALMTEWRALFNDGRMRKIEEKVVHASHLIHPYLKKQYVAFQHQNLAYHMPCHLKAQPNSSSSVKLLNRLPGLTLKPLKSHCCGMAGTWGMAAANYPLSRTIGRQLVDLLNGEAVSGVVTDCPTCIMQLEQLGRHPVYHPLEVVSRYLKRDA